MKNLFILILLISSLYSVDFIAIKKTNEATKKMVEKMEEKRENLNTTIKELKSKIKQSTLLNDTVRKNLNKATSVLEFALNKNSRCNIDYTDSIKLLMDISTKEKWSEASVKQNKQRYKSDLSSCLAEAGNISVMSREVLSQLKTAQEQLRSAGMNSTMIENKIKKCETELTSYTKLFESLSSQAEKNEK